MNKWWAVAVLAASAMAQAQDARGIVEESQRRNRSKSQRYEGTLEVINAKSKVTTKQWEYLRLGDYGDSKAMLRFTEPPEVKGVALLIHNHPDRASDQWMWRPQIGRDQRVALQDRSARFFGTDFSFEDLEERDVNQFDYKLAGEETIDGAACWKLESRPKQSKTSQYTHSFVWIRKDNYVFAQIEGFTKAGLSRRINYREIQQVQGHWTARRLEVLDAKTNSRTVLKLEKLQFDAPIGEGEFTLQALRRS
ncbi:MAG: outer membrane lipoprotein-sorting protein [Acidobacteria bacterium]|nr:outer membrane lipoprotein-sorting protein [Acidobacteriota bacterium]